MQKKDIKMRKEDIELQKKGYQAAKKRHVDQSDHWLLPGDRGQVCIEFSSDNKNLMPQI